MQARYQLQLDLREAGELAGSRGWEGDVLWRGEGSYGAPGWQFEGDLEVRTSQGGIAALRGVPWSAQSKLRLAPLPSPENGPNSSAWRAELQGLAVTALGGRFTGSATVEIRSPKPAVHMDLQAQRISLPALLEALATERLPLGRLAWAGAISGPVQADFAGLGENLRIRSDWQVEPPAVVPTGFLPASGRLQGSYQAAQKRLETQDSVLHLPQTRLSASGWLDDHDSRLDLGLDTTQLEEVRPLTRMLGESYAELPLQLSDRGRVEARLLWSGGVPRPRFDGDFRLAGFNYQSKPWDQFSGTLHYQSRAGAPVRFASVEIDSGRLVKEKSHAEFQAQFGLEDGSLARRNPFSVDGTVRDVNLDELQRLLGVVYPILGTLDASGRLFGTPDEPRGEGTIAIAAGTIYDEPFDRLTARLSGDTRDLFTASQVRIERGAATLAGNATVNRRTEEYKFALTGSDLPLSEFRFLKPDSFSLSGVAQITLTGEGSRDRPQARGKIEVRRLGLDGEGDGAASLDVETRDRRAYLRGTAGLFGTEMRVSSETLLEEPFPTSTRLEFVDVDLPRMIRPVRQPPESLTGRASGTLLVEGDLRHPERIVIQGDLPTMDAALGAVEVRADRPVRFRYQNRQIQLEQFHLAGSNLDLEATGSIRLGADPALNLTARGRADLAALPVGDPQLSAAGQVSLDAILNGTLAKPVWRGRLLLSDGSLRYGNLPNSLAKIKGTVVFDGNRGLLEDFAAESGGGQLRFGGFVAFENAAPGWQVQLTADADAVRVRYPRGISTVLSGRLTLSGTAGESVLGGALVIRRQSVSPGFDLAQALVNSRGDTGSSTRNEFLRNMRLDLQVTSAPDVRLETAAVRNLQGDVDLRMQGTLERPVWLGRIGIQEGELFFAGKKYTVSRGEIAFLNPFRIEPILSLSVQARVQQYEISMDFAGPPDRLTLTYRSDPPLPTRDILALLVAGSSRPSVAETAASQPVPEIGAGSLLSQALTAQLGSRLDRIFGAGRIRVDPQLAGVDRPLNASVAFEQQIRENLTLTYITNVTSVRQQIIRGEWAISPRFSVAAIRDENGLVGVNFQMTLRFR